MAEELGVLIISNVGGVEHEHVLLPPLETLSSDEETCVRESDLVDHFTPLVKLLAARVSDRGVFHISAPDMLKTELGSTYGQISQDDMTMVRRAGATNLKKFAATTESPHLKKDIISMFEDLTKDDQDSVGLVAIEGCAAMRKWLGPHDCVAPVILNFSQDKSWHVSYLVANQFYEPCDEAVGPEPTRTERVPAYVRLLRENEATEKQRPRKTEKDESPKRSKPASAPHIPHNVSLRGLLWLLITIFVVGHGLSTASPALTITSPDGDIIDCVDMRKQPTLNHPLLQNHVIQETPTYLPNMVKSDDEPDWQIWHRNGTRCPEGTIPLRRLNRTTRSPPGKEATIGHEYAFGFLHSPPAKIYGGKVTMNVWRPKVEQVEEFSLGQIWVISGSYKDNDLNSMEAGWQVYPQYYGDDQPRFFIFWTNDTYSLTACYNHDCHGFIQTSQSIVLGGAVTPTSTFGGRQMELTVQIWKDLEPGHWWLSVGFSNSTVLVPVGYWPREIFTRLADYAEDVHWGGEIVDKQFSGHHTTTQMGSGYYPDNDKAAYMRDLQIAARLGEFQPVYDLAVGVTNSTYYGITKFSNTSFAYGGPERAGVVQLQSDLVLVYLFFSFFLLF